MIDNSIAAKARNIGLRFAWDSGYPWLAIIDDGSARRRVSLSQPCDWAVSVLSLPEGKMIWKIRAWAEDSLFFPVSQAHRIEQTIRSDELLPVGH